ncbi:SLBB domain protein [Posidoniimonas polymericola]|uniref:SLBB domain protein n=1 Tax=Posidoniimonas polymericola TaxID=2528002 RepID=A0A5C5YSD8_9BACT|nr:SLBB domain-containing protein [Posidoniimonas polymericola]TWT77786.1 SLBB domain protein [Posidoniimonas polymericola]
MPSYTLQFRLFTAAVLLSGAALGCHSAQYRAADLPLNMRRSAALNSSQIQISSLASGGGKSTTIGADDLLSVQLATGVETTEREPLLVRVDANGDADVPLIGPVRLAGLDVASAGRQIGAAAVERGIYQRPQVTVQMHEQATNRVVVLGAVTNPGAYEIPRAGCDVASAIALAGGLTEDAGPEVELLRQSRTGLITADVQPDAGDEGGVQQVSYQAAAGGPVTERINLAQAGAGSSTNQRLDDRDVVMVHPKEKRVFHVTGLVERPDQFELPDDQVIRVLDALAMAGGTSSPVADRVFVIRQNDIDAEPPVVIEVSIAKAKMSGDENLVIGSGDLVSVEQTAATTVLDAFRNFFRVTMGVSSRLAAF